MREASLNVVLNDDDANVVVLVVVAVEEELGLRCARSAPRLRPLTPPPARRATAPMLC